MAKCLGLELAGSQDVVCKNIMCEHVGDACPCRLSLVLERLPNLQRLNIASNGLKSLPPALFTPTLTHLVAADNRLDSIEPECVERLEDVQVLDLSHNQLNDLPVDQLATLSALRLLKLTGNPLDSDVTARLRTAMPPKCEIVL